MCHLADFSQILGTLSYFVLAKFSSGTIDVLLCAAAAFLLWAIFTSSLSFMNWLLRAHILFLLTHLKMYFMASWSGFGGSRRVLGTGLVRFCVDFLCWLLFFPDIIF